MVELRVGSTLIFRATCNLPCTREAVAQIVHEPRVRRRHGPALHVCLTQATCTGVVEMRTTPMQLKNRQATFHFLCLFSVVGSDNQKFNMLFKCPPTVQQSSVTKQIRTAGSRKQRASTRTGGYAHHPRFLCFPSQT